MKRMMLLMAVAMMVVAMVLVTAGPALAAPGGNFNGKGDAIGGGTSNPDNGQHNAVGGGQLNNPNLCGSLCT